MGAATQTSCTSPGFFFIVVTCMSLHVSCSANHESQGWQEIAQMAVLDGFSNALKCLESCDGIVKS